REPYYERGYSFDDYLPAYRTGWEGRVRYPGRTFEQAERELSRDYQRNRGASLLDWRRNRHAARAASERVDRYAFTNSVTSGSALRCALQWPCSPASNAAPSGSRSAA